MAIRSQLRLVQLTGSLNDSVGAQAQINATSLQGVLDQTAAAVKRIHGAATFTGAAAGEFTHSITPAVADGAALGSAAKEWSDLFLGDEGVINLGEGQDVTLTHVPDTGVLLNSSRQLQFGDSATFINQSSDGNLGVTADVGVKVTGPTTEIEASSVLLVDSPIADFEDAGVVLRFGALGAKESLTHIAGAGLRMAGSGSFQFRDADLSIGSDANGQLDLKADTEIEMTTPLVEISGDLTVQGNDLDFAAGAVNINASGGNANDTVIGSAGGAGGLKVMYNRLKNAAAQEVMTFSGQEVIIPGDLTVKGATTTIDTTNLEVEDKLIGMNYTSGSTAGALGDAGLLIGNSGGTQRAWYYDSGDQRWAAVETNDAPSAASITPTAFLSIDIADVHLNGLDVYGDGTGAAITLTTGDTPDVGVINHLTLGDDKQIRLGASQDATIEYMENGAGASADKFTIRASAGEGIDLVAPAAKSIASIINTNPRFIVLDSGVQVGGASDGKIESSTGVDLLLSASAGQEVRLASGADLMFLDVHKPASWSDAEGVKLAASANDWSDFESTFGSEVSILRGIVRAAGGAGTIQKRVVEVGAAGISAGADVETGADLDALTPSEINERVDVFVNGQLMVSSSDVASSGDYALDVGAGFGDVDVQFQFDLVEDDVVSLVVR